MKKFIMEDGEKGTTLTGMLTVENAAAIRAGLLKEMRQRECVTLSVGEDAVVDVSFLQILCAAARYARKEKRIFRKGVFGTPLISAMLAAGFVRREGCGPAKADDCICAMGGEDE